MDNIEQEGEKKIDHKYKYFSQNKLDIDEDH